MAPKRTQSVPSHLSKLFSRAKKTTGWSDAVKVGGRGEAPRTPIICYTRADEDMKNTIGAATATGRSTCYPNASRSRKIVKLMACDVKHSVHGTRVMNSNE